MNKWLKLYALCAVLTGYITMIITFTIAYFNNMQTLVTINDYGEANLEVIIIGSSLLILLIWCFELLIMDKE